MKIVGKGSKFVHPITDPVKIKEIRDMLRKRKSRRDLLLFECGVSWGLRGGDLLSINRGDVCAVAFGDSFILTEAKTKKPRRITMNKKLHDLLHEYLAEWPNAAHDEPLFIGQRGRLTTSWLCRLVSDWCEAVGLRGSDYGAHTLRKTAGYHRRLAGITLPVLCQWYGHSSEALTLRYLGIQPEEIQKVYEIEF